MECEIYYENRCVKKHAKLPIQQTGQTAHSLQCGGLAGWLFGCLVAALTAVPNEGKEY